MPHAARVQVVFHACLLLPIAAHMLPADTPSPCDCVCLDCGFTTDGGCHCRRRHVATARCLPAECAQHGFSQLDWQCPPCGAVRRGRRWRRVAWQVHRCRRRRRRHPAAPPLAPPWPPLHESLLPLPSPAATPQRSPYSLPWCHSWLRLLWNSLHCSKRHLWSRFRGRSSPWQSLNWSILHCSTSGSPCSRPGSSSRTKQTEPRCCT